MRLLVPAALAALIAAVALSATAAVPAAVPAAVSAAGARPAPPSPVHLRSWQVRSQGPALPTPDPAAANTTPVAPRGGFAWPLSPRPAVLRRFEQPVNQWSPGHRGVDLLAAAGEAVLSAGEGVVAFSGVIAGRGVVTVRHPGGLRTTYEPVDDRLPSGSLVHRGTRIGVISPTPGHCMPIRCLHWGAVAGLTYRDPLLLLGFSHPILLPLG